MTKASADRVGFGTKLLDSLATLVLARPGRVLVISTLLCLVVASAALTAPLDMSFLAVLPDDDPRVVRFMEVSENVGLSRQTLLLMEGPEDVLPQALIAAEAALEACPRVEWTLTGPEDVPGARLITASLDSDPMTLAAGDIVAGRSAFSVAEGAVIEALDGSPVTLGWAGAAPQTIQDLEATMGRAVWLTPLCLLLVLGLLRLAERRLHRLALIAAPMGLAVGATLGVSALVFGNISFNESFFGVVVCGLGADFALHLIVRVREERAGGVGFEEALRRTLRGAGRAILAGAATTSGAFTVLSLAPESMPQRMGLAGAVGLTLCLVLMLTWLPAAWVLLERRSATVEPRVLEVPLIGRLASGSVRRPRLVTGIALIVLALSLVGLGRFRYETDFGQMINRGVPIDRVNDRLQELFGANSSPWIVASDTVEEAHRVQAAFVADPTFVRVDGAASLLPPDASELPPGTPTAIAALVQGRDGRWLTWAWTGYAGMDTERLAAGRRRAEEVDPGAAGYGMFIEAIVSMERPWTTWVGLGILALVLFVLAVDLRGVRWVLLAITPAAVGMTVTLGLLCWLDMAFVVAQVLSVPLLLGLGVDDGLHVVHRLREGDGCRADRAAVSVGRAIVVTTLTTCASFLALALSNNPSLERMALVMLIGLPICLFASVTLLPAMATLMGLGGADAAPDLTVEATASPAR